MSTEVCTSLGPSAALDLANSSASNVAPGVKYDVAYPSPSPTPDINSSPNTTPDGLANLTPLPVQSPNEIQDLDPNYPNYRATIHYYTLSPSGKLTQETHPNPVSRASVLLSLEYFYTLRKQLTANLALLETYPGTSLAAVHDTATRTSSSFTELERCQNEFSMHHIAINENLRAANSDWGCHAFGLPDPLGAASDVRCDRNFFAHEFPTPGGKGVQLVWAVRGKGEGYGKLLGFVEDGVCVLQGQLDEPEIWVSPQVIERERLEREAREEEERLDKEGVERDDDGGCVLEQEEEVECIEPTQSPFSRVFDGLGGNVVFRYFYRFGVVRKAGWMLFDWLGEMLEEADAVALCRAGEGATEECEEGDDWGSQEDEIGDDDCGSQEYKIEDGDCKSQEHRSEDDEGYRSQDIDAPPSQPNSGWGEPQW